MDILFENRDIAVCIKPVGLDSEQELPEALKEQLGGEIFPLHRLDKNVAGVMVYARNKKAAAQLSAIIAKGEMVKEYVALVHGTPPENGDWEDFLFKDSGKNKVFVVKKERKGVKFARLEYQLLKSGEQSLVHIRLHTGRSHQIRVQFSSRGMPLVGERKYCTLEDPCEIALWSYRLAFNHPYSGKPMEFSLEPPDIYPWSTC